MHRRQIQQPDLQDHDDSITNAPDIPYPSLLDRTPAKTQNTSCPLTYVSAATSRENFKITPGIISRNNSHLTSQALKCVTLPNYDPASYVSHEVLYDHGRRQNLPHIESLLRRSLGGLEIMYHHTVSKGMDMIYLMTNVSTTFPVTPALTEKALVLLAQKHALLRMTIQSDSGHMSFLEMDTMRLDFSASDRKDWLSFIMEEVTKPFDISNGPLWKCRLLISTYNSFNNTELHFLDENKASTIRMNERSCLNSIPQYKYQATFFFILHHSIMDGSYVILLFKQFAELLNLVNCDTDYSINRSETVPLLPPIEDVIVCPLLQRHRPESPASIHFDKSYPSNEVLLDYNEKFSFEIEDNEICSPRNQCIIFEFTQEESQYIADSCRESGAPANGIFLTASLLAFVDLVYPSSSRNDFHIPFEFMLDLRRCYSMDFPQEVVKYYPGAASMHVPFLADIELSSRPVTKQDFRRISKSFGSAITKQIMSADTRQWIRKTIKETLTTQKADTAKGKSPYVLCVSNMGCLDGTLTGDVTKTVRLNELHGHSTVLNDDSPIFFVGSYSLNGRLCGNVSFCENYTSVRTAMEYVNYLKKYIVFLVD